MRHRLSVFGIILIAFAGLSLAGTTTPASPSLHPSLAPQGCLEVQALVGGFWQPAGDLPFGTHFREAEVSLPAAALAAPRVRVRLVQHGGGAAHLDEVSIGSTGPVRVQGASEPGALALVLRTDHDVLDVFGKTIDLTFPSAAPGSTLRLVARVEGPLVEGEPFAFPPANQFRPLTAGSAFYRYRPTAGGRAPSWPEALDPATALFAERCSPTTGHPEGVTWGWVANDDENLYAAVEFTPDNTRDGDADWASVQVETGGEIREFRVSERETRWGRPSFAPTARAAYRHKLYEFAIPFSELGSRDAGAASELKLAFSAYGTAAISWLSPQFRDFGSLQVGSTSPSTTFTITNTSPGQESMVLGTPWYTRNGPNSAAFPLAPGTCGDGLVLSPGSSCDFQVAFAPTTVGAALDDIVLTAAFGTAPPVQAIARVQGNGLTADVPVPALGAAGLAALALVLAGAGLWAVRRA
jgi:hypothetical protein